ncbi:MAG: hypothetical protein IJA89_07205 [Clostridia bacterium]|nr:hypothetical protein [Clostridia bacterium]
MFKNGKKLKTGRARSAKECAYLAVFVALVIAAQVVFSAIPGVELVTVLFVAYAYVYGCGRGMTAATAFALVRQLVFGFYPTVLVLYLVYYNLLTLAFGLLGRTKKPPQRILLWIVFLACLGTVCFSLIDNILTPVWYGYSKKATRLYFTASLPFMIPQTINAAISVSLLFMPLYRVFLATKRTLGGASRPFSTEK